MYNYTYLCAYQLLMIAILTKWLPFYKKNEFYFAAVVVVVTWWCFVSLQVRLCCPFNWWWITAAAAPPPDIKDALSELQPWQRSSNWSILLSNVLPQHLLRQSGSCVLYAKIRQQSHLSAQYCLNAETLGVDTRQWLQTWSGLMN